MPKGRPPVIHGGKTAFIALILCYWADSVSNIWKLSGKLCPYKLAMIILHNDVPMVYYQTFKSYFIPGAYIRYMQLPQSNLNCIPTPAFSAVPLPQSFKAYMKKMTKLQHSLPQQALNVISSKKFPHGIKFTSIFTQVTQHCTKDKAEKNTAVTTSHCLFVF